MPTAIPSAEADRQRRLRWMLKKRRQRTDALLAALANQPRVPPRR